MIGQTISHYRILDKLGEGGMGVVYRALDLKLNREVAVKFLLREFVLDEGRRARFTMEARSASALNHPNVATIYELEDAEDHTFIAMEFVQGETLRQRLHRSPLQIREVIEIALQIAAGLAAAHEKKIIHRDIKSDNVMITPARQAKIMDFGLAKLRGTSSLTGAGAAVGTISYMAPEQVRDEKADQRSDIWSFGVVLYEMLTEVLPFTAEHPTAVMYEIVSLDPKPVTDLRADCPDELAAIVSRCLEKEPAHRYQQTPELIADLRLVPIESSPDGPGRPGGQPARRLGKKIRSFARKRKIQLLTSAGVGITLLALWIVFFSQKAESGISIPIVVTDVQNTAAEKELDALSGLLITALSNTHPRRLDVYTRDRMFDIARRRGAETERIDENLGRQICSWSDVHVLITSAIFKLGRLYVFDVKGTDPGENEPLFAMKEETDQIEQIPSLIDGLAEKIDEQITRQHANRPGTRHTVAEVTSANLEAYRHLFVGEQHISKLRFDDAAREFRSAIALDSTCALAYFRLAYAGWWASGTEQLQKDLLRRALSLPERIPEKEFYLVRAQNAVLDSGYAAGIAILKEMEQHYPNEKEMLFWIGDYAFHASDDSLAARYFLKTVAMDPTFQPALQHLAWVYRNLRRYDIMLQYAAQYAATGTGDAYSLLGEAQVKTGDYEAGIQSLEKAREMLPDQKYAVAGSLADAFVLQGKYPEAETVLKTLVEQNAPADIKSVGYTRLAAFYPRVGKYRDAKRMADASAGEWQKVDSALALPSLLLGELITAWGWHTTNVAKMETPAITRLQKRIADATFWAHLAELYIIKRDLAFAESIVREKLAAERWTQEGLLSLIRIAKQDCSTEGVQVDSVMNAGAEGLGTALLFYQAECQYQAGELDGAIRSIQRLQKSGGLDITHAVFFPMSFCLLGKVQEKKADRLAALQSYEKFLDMWKNGDADLPELKDAASRLHRLRHFPTMTNASQ